MSRMHRSSRPWDPTPREAEVTRCAVELVAGFDEMIAQLQAQRAAAIEIAMGVALAQHERYERVPVGETREGAPVFDRDDAPVRAMIAELAAATRRSRRAVAAEVDDVWLLAHRFDRVRASFCAGEVDAARASVLVGEGARLSDDAVRAEFERLALPHARAKTVYGTEVAARRIAAELEPESITVRQERARRDRGVFVRALDDGMAELTVVSDAVTVFGAHDRLTQMARRVVAARGTGEAGGAAGSVPEVRCDGCASAEAACDDCRTAARVACSVPEVRCDACEQADAACGACADVARAAAEAFAGASCDPVAARGVSAAGGIDIDAGASTGETRAVAGGGTGTKGAGAAPGPVGSDGAPILDERTFSQVRADVAIDVLLTGQPDAHHAADPTGLSVLKELRGRVQITIPVATLTGLDDAPADLSDYGPVAEAVAGPIAATAGTWARVFRDPGTGALLTVDRYMPTAEQRRYLLARHDTCAFLHCERRATAADIDHTIDYALGGGTVVTNLVPLCRFHHTLKHTTAWSYRLRPDGEITWTSPAGREYGTRPGPTVAFVDAEHAHAARRRRNPRTGDDSASLTGRTPSSRTRRAPSPGTGEGSASRPGMDSASGAGDDPASRARRSRSVGMRSAPGSHAETPATQGERARAAAREPAARRSTPKRSTPPRPARMRRTTKDDAKAPF